MASVTISLPDKDAKLGCGFESSCRVVTKVQPGGLAHQHQVAPGFILISINGHDCDAMADISEIKEKLKERPVTLLLEPPRDQEAEPVEPENRSHQEPPEPVPVPEAQGPQGPEPEGAITLTATEGGLGFGVSCFPPAEQIFVKKVDAGSWAAQHGLREGFQLLKVQGKDAGSLSPEEFRSAMKSQRPLELSFLPAPESSKESSQEVAEKAAQPPEAQAVTGTEKPAAETKETETNEVKAEESSAKQIQEPVEQAVPKHHHHQESKDGDELATLKKKLAESTEELQRAQTELSQAVKKSETSQEQLTKLKEELEAKNRDLKERQELSAVNEEETKKEIAQLKEQVAAQEEELKRTKEDVQTARANKERRKSQNQSMEAKLKQQEPQDAAIAGAEDDFAKRVRESAEVRDLKRQVELEIQTLRSELEELKAQVGSMRGSLRGSFAELPGASSFKPLNAEATTVMEANDVNLFRAAQPLLRPNTEKRGQAVQAVEVALQKGASPNSWQGPGSPLQAAVQARAPDLVKCLLKAHADPGEIDAHGVSLLHLATFHGEAEVSKLLLEANANPNVTDRYAQTPIFFAPTRQVCMTLHNFNADVNAMNSKGQSPLHLAAKAGLGDVMHWLAAKASPDVLSSKDANGQRAADYAKAAGLRMGKLEGRTAKSPRPPTSPTSPTSPARSPCGAASPQESRSGNGRQGPFRIAEPSK